MYRLLAAHLIGYGYATLVAWPLITMISIEMWRVRGLKRTPRGASGPDLLTPQVAGLIERVMYVAALDFLGWGASFLIGSWLLIKAAGNWKTWNEGVQLDKGVAPGRAVYQSFLVGSGLSVVFAFTGFQIINLIRAGFDLGAAAAGATAILAVIALWVGLAASK